ncbi:MAG: hypothetical protein ORN98_10380 [Alphaproteobacteria bacterium]|nr:hypothetical protein [Alphaproteobacteria bacterium]
MANNSHDFVNKTGSIDDEWTRFGEYNKEKAEQYVAARAKDNFPSNTEVSSNLHTMPGLTDEQMRFILGRK